MMTVDANFVEITAIGFAVALVLVVILVVWVAIRANATRTDIAAMMAERAVSQDRSSEMLIKAQAELTGRLEQLAQAQSMSQAQLSDRLQTQERALSKTLDERLGTMSHRIGEGLQEQTRHTAKQMTDLKERLAVLDAAQKNITELSQQVVSLQDILSNKQTRGAFGEVQLNSLVTNALPPAAYDFQVTLSNGKRADCLLKLPNPQGAIVIDSKFPLESYNALQSAGEDAALRTQAERTFRADILKHVKDIAGKYILPGETSDSALMFLPSEAVYAELHANFADTVEKSYQSRVWIVSPTTLMATLNTVRAILKDARLREQAGIIRAELQKLVDDTARLDDRVGKLQRHFDQSVDDIRQIRISTDKVVKRGERLDAFQFEEESPAEDLPPPQPRLVD